MRDTLVADMGNDIIFGRCPPGARIVGDRVMERHGARRHAVRGAFAALEARGLLVRRPNRGVGVVDFGPDQVAAPCDARIVPETAAAARTPLPCTPDVAARPEDIGVPRGRVPLLRQRPPRRADPDARVRGAADPGREIRGQGAHDDGRGAAFRDHPGPARHLDGGSRPRGGGASSRIRRRLPRPPRAQVRGGEGVRVTVRSSIRRPARAGERDPAGIRRPSDQTVTAKTLAKSTGPRAI